MSEYGDLLLVGVTAFGVLLVLFFKKPKPKPTTGRSSDHPTLSDFIRVLLLERADIEFDDYSREFYQSVIQIRKLSEVAAGIYWLQGRS